MCLRVQPQGSSSKDRDYNKMKYRNNNRYLQCRTLFSTMASSATWGHSEVCRDIFWFSQWLRGGGNHLCLVDRAREAKHPAAHGTLHPKKNDAELFSPHVSHCATQVRSQMAVSNPESQVHARHLVVLCLLTFLKVSMQNSIFFTCMWLTKQKTALFKCYVMLYGNLKTLLRIPQKGLYM